MPMTVITCSLDFPEFQTWLHNDRGGVLPVAITGQVQPPGDLDQSRSDRHNSIGIWRETNPSASQPPPPDGRRAVGEQEVKPLCRHLNPPLHSSSFRPFNFCCGYCPRPHLSQPALKYLCLSIVKEVKKLRRRARVGGVSSISGAIESRGAELSRCRLPKTNNLDFF